MDELSEFLKVYPLNDATQDSFNNLNIKSERQSTPDFLTYGIQTPSPQGFTAPYQAFPVQYGQPPAGGSLRIPDLKALISDGQESSYLSQIDLDPISFSSQMAPHTGTRGAMRAQAAQAQPMQKPSTFLPGHSADKKDSNPRRSSAGNSTGSSTGSRNNNLISNTNSVRSTVHEPTPQMPVLADDGDFSDHGEDSNDARGGKVQTGRQRTSGPLSAHAIYARMNRERKKKYIADLEDYRKVMCKKRVDQRKELDSIHREAEALTQEIAALRNELVGNDTLMNLLSAGIRH